MAFALTRHYWRERAQGKNDGVAHCVASYGGRCAIGVSLVLSLRKPDNGQRLSTIELVPECLEMTAVGPRWEIGGKGYRLSQHRGYRNGRPPPEAEAMCTELCELLAGGHPVDASSLEPRPPPALQDGPNDAADLYPLWRPILPRSWRYPDAASFMAACRATQG